MKNRLSALAVGSTVGISLGHALGIGAHFYDTVPWFDTAMHLLGAWWVGVAVVLFSGRYPAISIAVLRSPVARVLAVTAAVTTIGVLWEFFEYGVSFLPVLSGNAAAAIHQSYADTLHDLFLDIVGGGAAGFTLVREVSEKEGG